MSDKLNYDRGFDVDFIKRTVWKALDLPDWIGFFYWMENVDPNTPGARNWIQQTDNFMLWL